MQFKLILLWHFCFQFYYRNKTKTHCQIQHLCLIGGPKLMNVIFGELWIVRLCFMQRMVYVKFDRLAVDYLVGKYSKRFYLLYMCTFIVSFLGRCVCHLSSDQGNTQRLLDVGCQDYIIGLFYNEVHHTYK
jgi:hypothetical protein